MDCFEAHRLLDTSITPGPATPQSAALGFHLATCATCRAYRAALPETLLNELLRQAAAPAPAAAATVAPPAPAKAAPRRERGARWPALRAGLAQLLWYAGMTTLLAFGLLVLLVVGSVARSAVALHENVQAMIVATAPPAQQPPTAPALPLNVPAPVLPTATARATPRPSVPTPAQPTLVLATPTAPTPASGDAVTVLLLGVDRRPGETAPPHADAIIIARFDPQQRRVALLSLPRDLVVPIPGFAPARINSANILGERYRVPGGGVELTRQTLSRLLDISIDYAVLVDFQGFIGAIDTLGGVNVDVERELYDARFPTMNYGYTIAHFLPGPQQLDGAGALMFSRIRHSDSDFARIRRQQQVLLGVVGQLQVGGARARLDRLEALTGALRGYVQTDMPEARMVGLAWALRDIAPEQIERYAMRADQVTFGIGTDRWAELAKPGVIKALAAKLMGRP